MKYNSKEVKIALTAIVAIVMLFFTINFLKGRDVFKSSNLYYVEFDNIAGLAVSNAVYANGYPVGTVRTIDYDYASTNRVIVGIDLNERMTIPRGTRAELETSLMGGVTMNLILGANAADLIARGDTIKGGMHQGLMAKGEDLMPTVAQMMPKLDSILHNLNQLTASPALQMTLANAADASANLNKTTILLNHMMEQDVQKTLANLPQIATLLTQTAENAKSFSSSLAQIDPQAMLSTASSSLADVKRFTGDLATLSGSLNALMQNITTLTQTLDETAAQLNTRLTSRDNTAGLLLNDTQLYDNLTQTAANLRETARHADSLVVDLKRHPNRYVHFSIFGKKNK